MGAVALAAFAHHRLVIRRIIPALDAILGNQQHVILRIDAIASIERDRQPGGGQFHQFGNITHRWNLLASANALR